MNPNTLFQIATWLIPLIIAIVFHEVSHGLVARRLGDPTAEERGRLSLNPIRHIDPFGTVILPLILALSHAPVFGWARPVPVNYRRLRNPRRDMVLVALAGPGMNLLLAVLGAAALGATLSFSSDPNGLATTLIAGNAINFILINLFLAVFNLLPIPPFDGGHVVQGLLPPAAAAAFGRIGRYSLLVLVVLLLVLPALGINIVGHLVSPVVDGLATRLLALFGIRP
ncbi:site-2 protease family protein [Sphingomonas sp. URHD0057]|uniref:site-2 protease family protein n=1 Tax=Sphingomonas sp. URHD0057 TaxID=1380389 RepID=UPI000490F535|nr:site-2 protease family protein [Sphingomonas sp. URHD0057]